MRTVNFRPAEPGITNFGDELNRWLLPQFIPELNTGGTGSLMAIGTLLDATMYLIEPRPVIFGAGAGYGPAPNLRDYDVRFVRGPRTARVCGLSDDVAITDPAILVSELGITPYVPSAPAFMPRWTTELNDATLQRRVEDAGLTFISPMWEPQVVLQRISEARPLISEVLHGAVCADALRVPWIAAYSESGHWFKWMDWCASLDVKYDPAHLHVNDLRWISRNWDAQLSPLGTHIYRLRQVKDHVKRLRDDLQAGRV